MALLFTFFSQQLSVLVIAPSEDIARRAHGQHTVASTGQLHDLDSVDVPSNFFRHTGVPIVAETRLTVGTPAAGVNFTLFGEEQGVVESTARLGDTAWQPDLFQVVFTEILFVGIDLSPALAETVVS